LLEYGKKPLKKKNENGGENNKMNAKYKKGLKIVTLLITAAFIATASAATYYSLSTSSTVTIATSPVYLVTGADSTGAGLTIDSPPTSATFSGLIAYPNVTTTYGDAAGVYNSAGTSYQVRLSPVSFSDDYADQFKFICFSLVDGTTTMAYLNYTSDGATWTVPSATSWQTITTLDTWSISIETHAADDATAGSVTIGIAVDVQEVP
jgi:hypothetical protein